jgi:hypothetical protein
MSEPVVVDAQVKEPTRKTTLRSEGTGLLKKDLTEPTLLEISGYRVRYGTTCQLPAMVFHSLLLRR